MKIRDWRTGGGYLRGIDVSAYQGNIDYAKVRANGIKFAILRAYGSANSPDSRIVEYAQGFKSVGIPCGSYFFCTISNEYDLDSAREQANRYANKLEEVFGVGKWGDLLPFIDLEDNQNVGGRHSQLNTTQMLKWVDEFRRTFEAKFNNNVKLGLYTNWAFIQQHNNFNYATGGNILIDMPLWIAKWRTTSIPDIGGWTDWAMWQYTSDAQPFQNGQSVGVSSTGLDMNYVESLDHISSFYTVDMQEAMATTKPVASLTTANTIEVRWVIAPIAGIERLDVWRNGIRLGQLPPTTNYWNDTTVEDGKSYSYQIAVVSKNGQFSRSQSSNTVFTRTGRSSKPSGLFGEAFDREIRLSWEKNSEGEKVKGYSVYLDGQKVGYTEETTYTFRGLENGRIYSLQVQAHNEHTDPSPLSDPLQIAPILKRPMPPSMLRTKVYENGDIEVTWSYHKDEDFDYFYIVMDRVILADYLQEERFVIKNARVDIPHDIYVVAVDKQGDIESSNVTHRTLHKPPQVKGLKATPFDRKALISWDKPDFFHLPPLPDVPRTPDEQPEGSIFYVVQPEDTIDSIAEMHGTQFSLVVAWNYHLMDEPLVAGEILYLFVDLPQGTKYHIVQQHDTFAYIEELYNMPSYELQAFNPDVDPDNLIIGSKLIVRNPTQPVVPTTIEFRTETRTRKVQKVIQETKQVPTTTLVTPQITTYEELKAKCLALTGLFETSAGYPDAYGATAGNSDQAGMSFGALQYNFKSGTLQPVLRAMFDNYPNVVKNAFNYNANPSYYNTLKNVVYNMTRSQQVSWGASISTSGGKNIVEPYRTYFRNLGVTPECIAVQVQHAETFFNQAKVHFNTFGLTTRRAFALCFDIAIQNWSISSSTKALIFNDFTTIDTSLPHGIIETQKMVAIANRRANASNPTYIEDVRRRKLAIATGSGVVHGIAVNTEDYGLTLDPAFPENEGIFAQPLTTYETITVERIVEEEIEYEVSVPYIVATQPIPIGEVFVEKEVELEPPVEIDNFLLYQGDHLVAVLESEQNSYLVSGLENGVTYDFHIKAVSTQGLVSPDSATISVTPITDYPNKATDLQAEILDHKTILFRWQLEESPNFSHFEVYLNGKIILTSSDVTENTIKYVEAKPNYDYTLEIITYDNENDSVTSGTITQRIDIPSVPTGLSAVPYDREVLLTWQLNEESFVESYNIYLDGEIYAVVNHPQNELMVAGLLNDVMYDFKIQAISNKGFTSQISDSIFSTPVFDFPNVPKITYHKELGTGGIELNWEHEKKYGHSHYNVYKDGWLIASNITENKYMIDHLESNVTHTFQVEAFDYQGDRSGFSESYRVTVYAKILEPLSTTLGKVDKNMPVSKPKIYLCKPNKQVIAHLSEAYNVTFTERYADLNELTFSIPFEIESTRNELVENDHFKMIKERFLIKLVYRDKTEYFIINEISNYGENNSKYIHAWSLAYELKDKLISNYREEIWSAHSALLFALDGQLNWRIGANIKNPDFYWNKERRIFDVSNMTVLDFIIQVATSFNAILKWDTVNRIVDFENPMIDDVNKGLKIKYGKYLKSLSKTSNIEEMVTHLKPIGENNLTIEKATINGADYLEDFSYFMQGFKMESEEFSDFYQNSKAIVKDPTDIYYTETMGFISVPQGGIFTSIDQLTGKVSDEISIESVSRAIINYLLLYKTTQNTDYIDDCGMFANFLETNKIHADYSGQKFYVLPHTLTYDREEDIWKPQIDKINLQTLYLVAYALLEYSEHDSQTRYTDLVTSIMSFLAFAHNNVKQRIEDNNIEEGYEGLIYDHIVKIGTAQDGANQYYLSWNLFNNATLWYFAKAWQKFISVFSDIDRTDLMGNIYNPTNILDVTLNFYNQEYLSGRIVMSPTGLPYQYYHYYSPPFVEDDEYSVDEDNTLTIDVITGLIANDHDVDSEDLTAIVVTNPANGELTLNEDGSFTYTPDHDFFGVDTFTYKVNDGRLDSNIGTVTITVNPINDPPVAVDNIYIINEDTVLTTDETNGVIKNDYDVDSTELTAILLTTTQHGELLFNSDGTFTYTPTENYFGEDSFTYKISDGYLDSNVATVTITINSVNDAPFSSNDTYTTNEDTTLNVDSANGVLKNDTDIENSPLTAILVETTQHGTLTLNEDGSFVYIPNPNYYGTDTFKYKANDGEDDSEIATVTINITSVVDPQPENTVIYIVQSGDTFGKIAYDRKMTIEALQALNVDILDPSNIYIGQQIYVPIPKPPNAPTNILPLQGTTVNNFEVSATVSDPDSRKVKLIVESSLSSMFTNSIIQESDMVDDETTASITLSGHDINTVKTTIYMKVTASDGSLVSSPVNVSFVYQYPQPPNTSIYTIVAGDTLGDIAYRFGTTSLNLLSLNPFVEAENLYVGQQIYVPTIEAQAPYEPDEITPTLGTYANDLLISAKVYDPDSSTVKLIVEASLSSNFSGFVEQKESEFVNSGSLATVRLDSLDFNTINTMVYLRLKASDGTLESSVVTHNFIYQVPQPENTDVYTVIEGETLSSIAIKFNTTSATLLALNPMIEEYNIYGGQQIYVPRVEEPTELTRNYTVKSGETFSSIAIKFDTTSTHIQELNPTINPLNVYEGLVITVPLIEYNMTYTIVSGDTFSKLATQFGTTSARIQAVNPSVSPENLYVGLQILIPVPLEVYTVKSGDTISSVAVTFTTTITFLDNANPTLDPSVALTIGQKIKVPSHPTSEPTELYTVKSGDTVGAIATAHNTTIAKISELNPQINIDMIYIGQVLVVPKISSPSETYSYHLLTESELKWQALMLTSQYETSREYPYNFGTTSGNHDGAGISFGVIQFNAKTSSLIEQWQNMINFYPDVTLKAFTDNPNRTYESNVANHNNWKAMMLRGDFQEILEWADARSDTSKGKHALIEPWNTYFMNLGTTNESIAMQQEYASWYHTIVKQWFNQLGLWSRQGYALCFDIAVQSGSMNPKVDGVTYDLIGEINTWWTNVNKTGKTIKELEVMKLERIANRRSDYIDPSWQDNYRLRKVTIAQGYGVVNGLVMDTEGKYDMGLEPAFADNIPPQFTDLETEFAEEFYIDTQKYTSALKSDDKFIHNADYLAEFGGELLPLEDIQQGIGYPLVPVPRNYDNILDDYGDHWFKTENILKTTLGYTAIGLNEPARDFRNNILTLMSESHFTSNNEIVFYNRYSFEGIGGVDGDNSKPLLNTGLLFELENALENEDYIDNLKQTIYNYQIESENPNLNYGFISNIEELLSSITSETLSYIISPLSNITTLSVISHSPYMSDELCKAILNYNRLLEEHDGEYQELILTRSQLNEELVDLEYELTEREINLIVVQDLLDALRAEGSVFYTMIPYVGQPRHEVYKLKKDYTYALFAKTSDMTISIATNSGVKEFTKENEWELIEKIDYDREGEDTVESSIDLYDYSVLLVGGEYADIELQVTRILKSEFDETGNEETLIQKFIEEIHQIAFDEQTALVEAKKNEIANIDIEIENLRSQLSIYNNFTPELRKERDLFVITKEYIDETINNPEDLKNRALEKFKEMKKPTVTIEIDIVNFLELVEEHYNWDKLDIGTLVYVLYDKFDIEIEAKIIQIDYNFNEKTITLTISNVNDIKTNEEKFIQALYGAVSTSTTVSLEKHAWSKAIEVKEDFDSFVNQAFDATKQKIIAGTNESIEISRRGLLIKSDVDPMNYLVANSSVLAITNDGGKTYKNAITTEGVIAERLIGQIIAGENLIIENTAGNFRVDSEGVTIEGQGLRIIGGITNEHLSDDVILDADISGLTSHYIDTYEENNENDTIPNSPIIVEDGNHIRHTEVAVDLVDISFNWDYPEEDEPENQIDGFMIYLYTSKTSTPYVFGTKKKSEISFYVRPNKRSIVLNNLPKDLFYNFGIEAYRYVNIDVNIESVFTSPIVAVSTPYNPKDNTPYDGSIMGTVNYNNTAKISGDVITAIRQGQSYSNVTIDPLNGIISENNYQTQRVVLNEEGFRLQKKIEDRYEDILYADEEGTLFAEDLIANRLVVNDGSGRELINAHTGQINFDNFDVVTGNIHADNIDIRGLEVIDDDGTITFSVDLQGNVTIRGNVQMYGGSILWENVDKPTYTAEEVGARPNDWFPTASEVGARPSTWTPTYLELLGEKPPTDANNTFNELVTNPKINGFYADQYGDLYINATYIKTGELNASLMTTGTLDASQIYVTNLDASAIKTGTLEGISIDVEKDVKVGAELSLRYNVEGKTTARLNFFDYWDEVQGAYPSHYIEKSNNTDSLKIASQINVSIEMSSRLYLGYDSGTHYNAGSTPDDGESGWYTSKKEKGVCGIGGVNSLTTGLVAGTYVNFNMKKYGYTPLNPNFSVTSSNTNIKFAEISQYGFWIYIQESWTDVGYRYWRGYYNC